MQEKMTGSVELLFLQPTPFCNIDCDYCYLSGRGDRSRMSFDTLRRSLEWARALGARNEVWCVVWHIGEPLVVSADWYREAHRICGEVLADKPLELHFQTNATLLTPQWAELIAEDPRIQVCVSLDGPEWLHDLHRKTRGGRGTHARAVSGIRNLKAAGVPFDCIAVVTEATLDHPEEFFDFFAGLGPRVLSINAEAIDGANGRGSLEGLEREAKYRRFLRRVADLHLREPTFVVRNFIWADINLRRRQSPVDGSRLISPWRILSVDWRGNVHTFSPSLLGTSLPKLGPALGNVNSDSPDVVSRSPALLELKAQIDAGVEMCRASCSHFEHCGGGSPGHKWFEHGTFAATDTAYCRMGVQADWECYLSAVEESAQW